LANVSIPHRYDKNVQGLVHKPKERMKFQFLIGTIKTLQTLYFATAFFIVSIPHRYDKNSLTMWLEMSTGIVSIPHRYDKNLVMGSVKGFILKFQFLIGTIKT